ncbi:MAG: hypothetical protein EPO24_05970 [Bacteroidetes bacterium]|nr:MAG: hypothetical protein EPO24_05970 [Bacteroidota bacterium]
MNNNISWFGIALIVFGALLLLVKTDVLNIDFSQVLWAGLMVLGIGIVVKGFAKDHRGKIFWGTVLFLYSLYFFIHEFEFIQYYHHIFLPSTFLILGIAFLMLFISNTREWALLIPAFFFGGIGAAFLMSEMGYMYYEDVWDVLWHYWPILLIAIGLGIMFKRKSTHPTPPPQAMV